MVPMPKEKIATQVHDFTVLPLRYPALPAFPKETTHYLYLRANAPRVPTEDTPRELFLVNVPTDATELHMKILFADQLGGARVEAVDFEDARAIKGIKASAVRHEGKTGKKRKREDDEEMGAEVEVGLLPETWDRQLHRSGGTAVVRFVDRASAEMALREAKRAVKSGKEIVWGAGIEGKVPPLKSARYLAHHKLQYPDPAVLQESVDSFMSAFSAQEAERAKQLARQRNEPDEDGFITVTRGGRTGPAREEGAKAREEELKKREEELKKREKNRVKDDFYRFQVRQKKKEAAKELVKGFEEDRKKVEEMRKRRGRIRPE